MSWEILCERQILFVVALVINMFGVEISGEDPGVSSEDYGTGAQRPARSTPFRIRRKNFDYGAQV